MKSAVPPRVKAALVRTWFNGWCTGRRFQRQDCSCIFGCSAEDSIEHYSECRVVKDFAWRYLALPPTSSSLSDFLLLSKPVQQFGRNIFVRESVRTAAVYSLHCRWRHADTAATPNASALGQAAVELVRGHPAACTVAQAFVGARPPPGPY